MCLDFEICVGESIALIPNLHQITNRAKELKTNSIFVISFPPFLLSSFTRVCQTKLSTEGMLTETDVSFKRRSQAL